MNIKSIRRGDGHLDAHMATLCGKGALTTKQEQALGARIAGGDMVAADELLEHNLRFVVRLGISIGGKGLTANEAISAACLGAMTAARRFRPGHGRFISYAVWYIKRMMTVEQLAMSRAVRMPTNIGGYLGQARRFWQAHIDRTGRRPLTDDYEKELGSRAMANAAEIFFASPMSLDNKMGLGRKSQSFIDFIADPNEGDQQAVEDRVDADKIVEVMREVLTDREFDVIRLRLGLGDDRQWNLREIGEHFGFSRERARQVYEQAILKVRVRMGEAKWSDSPHWMLYQNARGWESYKTNG